MRNAFSHRKTFTAASRPFHFRLVLSMHPSTANFKSTLRTASMLPGFAARTAAKAWPPSLDLAQRSHESQVVQIRDVFFLPHYIFTIAVPPQMTFYEFIEVIREDLIVCRDPARIFSNEANPLDGTQSGNITSTSIRVWTSGAYTKMLLA